MEGLLEGNFKDLITRKRWLGRRRRVQISAAIRVDEIERNRRRAQEEECIPSRLKKKYSICDTGFATYFKKTNMKLLQKTKNAFCVSALSGFLKTSSFWPFSCLSPFLPVYEKLSSPVHDPPPHICFPPFHFFPLKKR